MAVHLIALHLALEKGQDARQTIEAMRRAHDHRANFRWLDPPRSLGVVTVLDVYDAEIASEHVAQVRRWTRSVWEAWAPYHATVREWAGLYAR